MNRIFPTTLKVKNIREEFDENETHKGYFDELSDVDMIIGVHKNKIHIACPQFWYRNFTFVIDIESCVLPEIAREDDEEVNECSLLELQIRFAMWKLIALVVKTECGRGVLYILPENFIRITHLNRKQAKQMYYLFKHVFDRENIRYYLKSSWRSINTQKWEAPDIRAKRKRRRRN